MGKEEEQQQQQPEQKMSTTSSSLSSNDYYYDDILKSLSNKNNPLLLSLSNEEIINLANEVKLCVQSKIDEWSIADNWLDKECQLLQISNDINISSNMSSQIRYHMSTIICSWISTFINSIDNNNNNKDSTTPELLKNKRDVIIVNDNDKNKKSKSTVYGPIPLPGVPGAKFEVWTNDAVNKVTDAKEKDDDQSKKDNNNLVTIILGAGNQSPVTICDTIDNLFKLRRPVLIKHHPLRPWLMKCYSIMLEPLITKGYVKQIVDEGIDKTILLLQNPLVGHIHVTGSYNTVNAIKNTLRQQGKKKKFISDKEIDSMVSSELGCATPMIFNKGTYSEKEIQHSCQLIMFGKKTNGGCNCLSSQVIIIPHNWKQKDLFRKKLLEEIQRQPTYPCYYPGSKERRSNIEKEIKANNKSTCQTVVSKSVSDKITLDTNDHLLLVECGIPGQDGYDSTPLIKEAFGPVLAIVELQDDESEETEENYLTDVVVPFLNDKSNIFGSLSCTIFTPATSTTDTTTGTTTTGNTENNIERAIALLQYGTIAINTYNGLGYLTALNGGCWGGHPLEKYGQSGTGYIGNQYNIPNLEKCVVYGPSLDNKPMFDIANQPPTIVMDIMNELTLTTTISRTLYRITTMLLYRSTKSILGMISSFFA